VPYAFCGTTVLGPADADRYLTENYGNWRVPVKTFHSAVDTTNQRVVRNPLSVAIFLRRALMADAAGRAALLRVLQQGGYITTEPGPPPTSALSAIRVSRPWRRTA